MSKMQIIDSHYHFDFIQDRNLRTALIDQLKKHGLRLVGQTVLPSQYNGLIDFLKSQGNPKEVIPSLGFHPWYITSYQQADQELKIFSDNLNQTHYIGEIGLDWDPKRLSQANQSLQTYVLAEIFNMLGDQREQDKKYILSIHTVRSANEVLDILMPWSSQLGQKIIPIFHRFNGKSDELTQLIRLGGYISVHPEMLQRKKGRAYIKQVPAERLLLESDLPASHINGQEVGVDKILLALESSLNDTLDQVSEIRQADFRKQLFLNQKKLYS